MPAKKSFNYLNIAPDNTDAMIAGFKAVKNKEAAIMNSISAQPERMEALVPVAAEAGCEVVALLWGPDGMPRDSNERAALAVDLLMALTEAMALPCPGSWRK